MNKDNIFFFWKKISVMLQPNILQLTVIGDLHKLLRKNLKDVRLESGEVGTELRNTLGGRKMQESGKAEGAGKRKCGRSGNAENAGKRKSGM